MSDNERTAWRVLSFLSHTNLLLWEIALLDVGPERRIYRAVLSGGLAMILAAVILLTAAATARSEERYQDWPLLTPEFPSTGGGGIIIKGYDPVVRDGKCVTPFTAHTSDGAVYTNIVEFDAEATAGGILCKNGKWRSADGSATGTTPLRVFIKDGVRRRSP